MQQPGTSGEGGKEGAPAGKKRLPTASLPPPADALGTACSFGRQSISSPLFQVLETFILTKFHGEEKSE